MSFKGEKKLQTEKKSIYKKIVWKTNVMENIIQQDSQWSLILLKLIMTKMKLRKSLQYLLR